MYRSLLAVVCIIAVLVIKQISAVVHIDICLHFKIRFTIKVIKNLRQVFSNCEKQLSLLSLINFATKVNFLNALKMIIHINI